MNVDIVAAQIRTLAPIFNGNVAGAAAYANGVVDQVWLPLPSAYVIPGDQDTNDNDIGNGLDQLVRERIAVIVVLETLNAGGSPDFADRRAQAASASIDTLKYAIFRAILGWRPDWDPAQPALNREARGIYFSGAGFPAGDSFDRARFFYQFTFTLETTITDADGWQLFGDPLTAITAEIEVEGGTATPKPSFEVNILPAATTT